ncbi:DUF3883 domain-containing protein [Oceanospirillaceae bacterium]|nr:DUF3883 domain-containing protein [Oceanospirillaceae bacterium]
MARESEIDVNNFILVTGIVSFIPPIMYLGRYPYIDGLKYTPPVGNLGCGVLWRAYYAERDARNRDLGLKGELLVLEFEKARLYTIGLKGLAELVRHVSVQEGNGAGYDILSFDDLGRKKYIEVKATRGGLSTDCFISPNELAFAKSKGAQFSIYRVYDFKVDTTSASFSVLIGDPLETFKAITTGYRSTAK